MKLNDVYTLQNEILFLFKGKNTKPESPIPLKTKSQKTRKPDTLKDKKPESPIPLKTKSQKVR